MSQETTGKKRGLTRPVEVVRAELLKDPDTKKIAQAVGMELEAYVELVLEYAQDKDKQPVLNVVDDAQLRDAGYTPPSAEEVAQIIVSGMKGELPGSGPNFEKSEFTQDTKSAGKPSLDGSAGQAPQSPSDPAARQDLMDQVKRGGGGGGRP